MAHLPPAGFRIRAPRVSVLQHALPGPARVNTDLTGAVSQIRHGEHAIARVAIPDLVRADIISQFLFNHLVTPPRFLRPASERAAAAPTDDEGETQTLLAEESLDDTAVLPVDLGRGGFDVVPPEEHATHPHGRVRTTSQGANEVAV